MHGSLVERDERIWSKSLEAINWEDIKFGHFTAEDCKMTWNVLHNQMSKVRTLANVLREVEDFVNTSSHIPKLVCTFKSQ
ncbi:hypothetical protein ScPMuIL_008428 [Solemya velum]